MFRSYPSWIPNILCWRYWARIWSCILAMEPDEEPPWMVGQENMALSWWVGIGGSKRRIQSTGLWSSPPIGPTHLGRRNHQFRKKETWNHKDKLWQQTWARGLFKHSFIYLKIPSHFDQDPAHLVEIGAIWGLHPISQLQMMLNQILLKDQQIPLIKMVKLLCLWPCRTISNWNEHTISGCCWWCPIAGRGALRKYKKVLLALRACYFTMFRCPFWLNSWFLDASLHLVFIVLASTANWSLFLDAFFDISLTDLIHYIFRMSSY